MVEVFFCLLRNRFAQFHYNSLLHCDWFHLEFTLKIKHQQMLHHLLKDRCYDYGTSNPI